MPDNPSRPVDPAPSPHRSVGAVRDDRPIRAIRASGRVGTAAAVAAVGGALWLGSFFLPSVRWEPLGRFQTDPGWVVARDSWRAMIDSCSPGGVAPTHWEGYVLMIAWAANVLVVAFCGGRGVLAKLAVTGGALLAWAPFATGLRPSLRLGFYVWACGLGLLSALPWLRRRGGIRWGERYGVGAGRQPGDGEDGLR